MVEYGEAIFAWEADRPQEAIDHLVRAQAAAAHAWPPGAPWALNYQLALAEYASRARPTLSAPLTEAAERAAIGLPSDHPVRFNLLTNLAQRAAERGYLPEYRELTQRAIDFGAQVFGPTDIRVFYLLQQAAQAAPSAAVGEAYARRAATVAAAHPATFQGRTLAMNRELLASHILNQNRPAEAVAELRQALTDLNGVPADDLRWAHIRLRLARALNATGDNAEALALVERAMPVVEQKLPLDRPARAENEQIAAMVLTDAGRAAAGYARLAPAAQAQADDVLDIVTRERSTGVIAARGNTLFPAAAFVALSAGRIEEGLRYAELASLSDLGASTAFIVHPDAGRDGPLKAAIQTLTMARETERQARRAAAATVPGQPLDARAEAALVLAKEAVARAEAALDAGFPTYRETLRPRPVALAALQAQLGPDEAAILPLILLDRVVTVAVTREGLAWAATRTGIGFADRIAALRASIDDSQVGSEDRFDAALAHDIYKTVFPAKIAAALRGKTHLIFPADGAFSYLPPEVLLVRPQVGQGRRDYLVRHYAVSFRSAFDAAVPAARTSGTVRFAGIGDPVLGAPAGPGAAGRALRSGKVDLANLRALPSLPGTAFELGEMGRAFGAGSLLLTGAAATETAVRTQPLGAYSVVAFATHGLVSGEIAGLREPALVMTPPASPSADDDGLLTASEIAGLTLATDWVILSACNTGCGWAERRAFLRSRTRVQAGRGQFAVAVALGGARRRSCAVDGGDGAKRGAGPEPARGAAPRATRADRRIAGSRARTIRRCGRRSCW